MQLSARNPVAPRERNEHGSAGLVSKRITYPARVSYSCDSRLSSLVLCERSEREISKLSKDYESLLINDVNHDQSLLRTSFLAPGRKCNSVRDATGLI